MDADDGKVGRAGQAVADLLQQRLVQGFGFELFS
jgi:hypothetical protein